MVDTCCRTTGQIVDDRFSCCHPARFHGICLRPWSTASRAASICPRDEEPGSLNNPRRAAFWKEVTRSHCTCS
ncbi:hypothetical protein COCSUDRAFT_33023 [Coccomyxa subellipsoidea C-169]|uniref:Uncharacterized protein n=1 Tax=Coccomyxa subellipsoidea (strain C-169) TaxID=574566 RepID=I0Z0W1_COCSC|nr:hypothetical protein COCSUDRAFT_33023 [Coccomyxa subellipsoidea C-169]EIE24280.1 hypothetical protein COCSUDRAFT_33023 [Coccomyxa subellipsoidea C-169]|eukprot:XP_005648824.1 hypothetical protein COCSUDRAFT_33023 [Coccomyxa subellipsoidea C-169]